MNDYQEPPQPPQQPPYPPQQPPYPPQHQPELSWIDKQFAHTALLVVIVAACFCQPFMLIFAIIGVIMCQDPKAKRNATIILVLSAVLFLLYFIGIILPALTGAAAPR